MSVYVHVNVHALFHVQGHVYIYFHCYEYEYEQWMSTWTWNEMDMDMYTVTYTDTDTDIDMDMDKDTGHGRIYCRRYWVNKANICFMIVLCSQEMKRHYRSKCQILKWSSDKIVTTVCAVYF